MVSFEIVYTIFLKDAETNLRFFSQKHRKTATKDCLTFIQLQNDPSSHQSLLNAR